MRLFHSRVKEYQLEKDYKRVNRIIYASTFLYGNCIWIGFIPKFGSWCSPDWVYPISYHIMMLTHVANYFLARHLWKKEYYMQEDLVCNATYGLAKRHVSKNIEELDQD